MRANCWIGKRDLRVENVPDPKILNRRDAIVKITDITGTVIYETRAEGGQAIWNGYSFDGRKASTGVYLVFISEDDGSETMVTKILFVN